MKIEEYINNKNKKIWDELRLKYDIILIYDSKETSWRIDTEDLILKRIITPTQKVDIPSFTHELLHLYIDDLGMSTPKEILHSIYGEISFNVLTENDLFSIIHNFCSHKKMFPYYSKMGFPEDNFLSKHAKVTLFTLFFLKIELKNKSLIGVTDYIGNVLSLFNNMGKNKEQYNKAKLHKLESLCPSLFKIIKKFDDNWKNSKDLDLAYYFRNFDTELEEWLIKNKVGNTI